ncbi:MAG: class A beta-lactamase, subclass A2 [Chitinophaga sp.]|uniref:class A beta-lactamase, subclass A2 n=1 Tax=Chitinophaga sp. TaxID=1869181 RepID=UPI0025C397CE|nr:class A beta-lactamase, subclass A2 [Chitinophaga sp.]MBV8253961.1 class A beta-lactamase, subclass A2 [Chitinophaga sp.]
MDIVIIMKDRKSIFTAIFGAVLTQFSISAVAQQSLRTEIATIAGKIPAKVGVFVHVLETHDTVSLNRDLRLPMQSVYKFPIAMAVLDQVDKGRLTLHQPIKIEKADLTTDGVSPLREKYPNGGVSLTIDELLDYNIRASDGSACDILLKVIGGTAVANRYIHQLGIKDMNIATTEQVQVQQNDMKSQYKNWCTPAAMTLLLEKFYREPVLSDSSKQYLYHLMATSGPGKNRLKAQLPAGTEIAHKTGTSWTKNGITAATNDAGIITLPNGKHVAITVFVSDAKATETEREGTIAAIAKAVWDAYGK